MLILFFIFSLLILFSTLGYGLLTIRLLKFEKLNLNYGIIGIFGLFLLSIVSIYTHLLFPAEDTSDSEWGLGLSYDALPYGIETGLDLVIYQLVTYSRWRLSSLTSSSKNVMGVIDISPLTTMIHPSFMALSPKLLFALLDSKESIEEKQKHA